ncbi:MAG: trypsin, partial [Deltaproteobacteria bacterium]|nr:trypsin [Deltaproteobacteria bacterium]
MKPRKIAFTILIIVFGLLAASPVLAQPEKGADNTLSPYFFVKSDNPETDRMPLKSTSAKVNVSGVIADVLITQVYKNEGKKPIEAIYVFPAS